MPTETDSPLTIEELESGFIAASKQWDHTHPANNPDEFLHSTHARYFFLAGSELGLPRRNTPAGEQDKLGDILAIVGDHCSCNKHETCAECQIRKVIAAGRVERQVT
jgi:hypothetical protein